MTYTAEQVIEAFDEFDKGRSVGILESMSYYVAPVESARWVVKGLEPMVEFVANQHDDGQMFSLVFKIADQYFGIEYQYSSWDSGPYFYNSGIREVFPHQVTYTEYR